MIQYMYSILDKVANNYGTVIFLPNDGVAIRSFKMECSNTESPVYSFPEDYALCCIGEFNNVSGEVKGLEPKVICRGLDFVRKEN